MRCTNIILSLLLVFIFTSCGKKAEIPDYSKAKYWLSLPSVTDKKVDVFYVYPTAWSKVKKNEPNICEIDNPSMLEGSMITFNAQATAFETVGNIYSPYYRQADISCFTDLSIEGHDSVIGGIPATDVISAFDYYIKNFNKGRPFILAGHSQGSNVLLFLLSKYMKENPKVYERMIAAYVIGYSVTKDYLAKNPYLKFAEGHDDTGVIISYNTEAPGVTENNIVLLPGAISINPINWSREENPASAEENLGSLKIDNVWNVMERNVKNFADARVDKTRGVVICSTADAEKLAPANQTFPKGVYHSYDYPFYYYNIRENAERRAVKFLSKQNN
jgi:Protein of unknown function (DUF3089)